MKLSVIVFALLCAVALGADQCSKMSQVSVSDVWPAPVAGALTAFDAMGTLTGEVAAMVASTKQLRVVVKAMAATLAKVPTTMDITIDQTSAPASTFFTDSNIVAADFLKVDPLVPTSPYKLVKVLGPYATAAEQAVVGGAILQATWAMTGATADITDLSIEVIIDYCSAVVDEAALKQADGSTLTTENAGSKCIAGAGYDAPTIQTVADQPIIQLAGSTADVVDSGFQEADILDIIVLVHDRFDTAGADFSVQLMEKDGVTPVGGACSAWISEPLLVPALDHTCYSSYVHIRIPWAENKQCGVYTQALGPEAPADMLLPDGSDGIADANAGLRRLRGQIKVVLNEKDGFDVVTDQTTYDQRDPQTTHRIDTFTLMYDVTEDQLAETSKYPRVFAPFKAFHAVADVTASPDPETLLYTIDAKVKTSIEWPFMLIPSTHAGKISSVSDTVQFAAPDVNEVVASKVNCNQPGLLRADSSVATADMSELGGALSDCAQVFDVLIEPGTNAVVDCIGVSPSVTLYFEVQCNPAVTSNCPLDATPANNVEYITLQLVDNLDLCPKLTDSVNFADSIILYEAGNGATALLDAVGADSAAVIKTDFFEGDDILVEVGASTVPGSVKVSVLQADCYRITVQPAYSDNVDIKADTPLVEIELMNQVPDSVTCGQKDLSFLFDYDTTDLAAGVVADGVTPVEILPAETVNFAVVNHMLVHMNVISSNAAINLLSFVFVQDGTHETAPYTSVATDELADGSIDVTFDVDVDGVFATAGPNTMSIEVTCAACVAANTITIDSMEVYSIQCDPDNLEPVVPAMIVSDVETADTLTPAGPFTAGQEKIVSQTKPADLTTMFEPSVDTELSIAVTTGALEGVNIVYQVHLVRATATPPIDVILDEIVSTSETPVFTFAAGSVISVLQETDEIKVTMRATAAITLADAPSAILTLKYRSYFNEKYLEELSVVPSGGFDYNDYFRLHLDPSIDLLYPQGLFTAPVDEADFYIVKFYTQVEYDNGLNPGKYYTASKMSLQSLTNSKQSASRSDLKLMSTGRNTQYLKSAKGLHIQRADAAAVNGRMHVSTSSLVAVVGGVAMLAVVAMVVMVTRRTQAAIVYQAITPESNV